MDEFSPNATIGDPQYYYGSMAPVPVTPPMMAHNGIQMPSHMYPFQEPGCVYFVPHYIPVYIDQHGNIAQQEHENIENSENKKNKKVRDLEHNGNEDR